MIKIGDTTKKTFILLLIYSLIIIGNTTCKFFYRSTNNFTYFLLLLLSYCFKVVAGFFEIYQRRSFRKKLTQPSANTIKVILFYLIIIALQCADVFYKITRNNDVNDEKNYLYFSFLLSNSQLLIIGVLSFIILHYKFGKHKIIGLLVTIVSIVFQITFSLIVEKQSNVQSFFKTLPSNLFEGIIDVLIKYLLSIKFQSPYCILFFTGLFQCISCIILMFTDKTEYNQFLSTGFVICCIFSVIFKGAKYYMNIFINYKYTPAHKIISNSFALFVFYLVLEFSKWEAKTLVGLIGFVVCLLGSLIYNEIIIITVWDLDRDTSEEINNRAINESNQIIDSFARTTLENLHEENEEEVNEDSLTQEH